MTASNESFVLPSMLGFQAAPELYEYLLKHCDLPVAIDASQVTHLGAPCLQVLTSASRTWREKSIPFQVANASAAFLEGLQRLGIGEAEFGLAEHDA